MKNSVGLLAGLFLILVTGHVQAQVRQAVFTQDRYAGFRDSLYRSERAFAYDSTNLFDDDAFIPGRDSFDSFLVRMEQQMQETDEGSYNRSAVNAFRAGVQQVAGSAACREIECLLYAEVVKSEQKMYLYLNGQPIDTFKVSTGAAGYETPNLNLRPSGPIFEKYSSRKYPGGNYQGLGNMPYAVFLKGGYAIHGTTTGNFVKLGTPASHGCVRLHPDNARVFNELVREIGLEHTWVRILD